MEAVRLTHITVRITYANFDLMTLKKVAQYSITISISHLKIFKIFITSFLMTNMNEVSTISRVNNIGTILHLTGLAEQLVLYLKLNKLGLLFGLCTAEDSIQNLKSLVSSFIDIQSE